MPKPSQIRPRTRPPEERREELLNAALHCFLKQGVEATTIEQITTTAEVAKGTFYLYFSSKEELLAGLGERFECGLLAKIEAAVMECSPDDWEGKLAAWAVACVHGYLDEIRLHDIAFFGYRRPVRQGLVDNGIINQLEALLKDGAAARAWRVEDARCCANFLFSGMHGVVDAAIAQEKRVKRTRLVQRLKKLCLGVVEIAG